MAAVSQRMSPRAPEPTWLAQRVGWPCILSAAPPPGSRPPLPRAWAHDQLQRPQLCSVALVLLDGRDLARRVSGGPSVGPSAGADLTFGRVFQMWNNSRSCIRYTWEKISDCHMVEVEPCSGTIGTGDCGRGRGRPPGAGRDRAPQGGGPGQGLVVSRDQLRLQPGTRGQQSAQARRPGPAAEGTLPCFLPPPLSLPLRVQ